MSRAQFVCATLFLTHQSLVRGTMGDICQSPIGYAAETRPMYLPSPATELHRQYWVSSLRCDLCCRSVHLYPFVKEHLYFHNATSPSLRKGGPVFPGVVGFLRSGCSFRVRAVLPPSWLWVLCGRIRTSPRGFFCGTSSFGKRKGFHDSVVSLLFNLFRRGI